MSKKVEHNIFFGEAVRCHPVHERKKADEIPAAAKKMYGLHRNTIYI